MSQVFKAIPNRSIHWSFSATTPPAWYCGMTYRLSYEKSPSIAFPSSDLYSLAAVNPIQSICIETCETCSLSIHFTYYCQSKEECQLNDEMPFVINLNNQSQWDTECKTSATSSNGSFFLSCEATINKNQLILSWNMKKYSQNGLPIEKSAVLIVVPELLVDNHQYIVLPNEAPIVNLEESEKPISVVLVIGNGEWQSLKGLTSNSSGKCTFGLSPFSPSNRTDVDGNIMEINGNGGSFVEQYLTSRIYTVLIPPKCSTKIAIQPLKSVSKRIEQSLCNGTTMITTPGYMNSWNVFDKEDFISYQIYCDNSPIDVLVKVMNLYDGILSIETKSEHKEETGKETVLFSDYYEWPKAFQYENITNIIIDWLSTNSSIHDGAFVFVTVEMSDDEKTTMMTTTSEVEKKKRQFFWIFIGAIGLIILIIISLTLCCIHGVKSGAFLRVLLRVSSVDPAIVEQVHKRLYHSQRKARKAEWKRSNGNANEHQFEGKPAEDIHL